MILLRRDFLKLLIAAPVALSIPLPSRLAQSQTPLPLYRIPRSTGILVGCATTGMNNDFLHLVVVLAPDEIESVDRVFLNGIESKDARFSGHVTIKNYLGSKAKAAYLYAMLKWNPTIFGSGIPLIAADISPAFHHQSSPANLRLDRRLPAVLSPPVDRLPTALDQQCL